MKRLSALAVAAALVAGVPAPAHASIGVCDVSARLDWGFKESFRAYLDSSIANGSWDASDGAVYESPRFLFPGEGTATSDGRLALDFVGTVNFTGHDGILDTTIANPVLDLGAETGTLLLDITGATMEGDMVEETAVPFLEIDLAGQDLEERGGIVTIVDAATRLTEEGSAAFPNYPVGEEFDPISVTVDASACDAVLAGAESRSGPQLPAVLTVSGILLVIATVVAAIRLRRRPDDAAPSGPVDL